MASLTAKDWNAVRVMEATNNARAAIGQAPTYNYTPAGSQSAPAAQDPGSGDQDPGGGGQTPGDKAQETYYNNLQAQLEAEQRQAREGAKAFLRNILSQYGMESLSGSVESLVGQWGNNTEVIAERLRQTDSYKTRFRGMLQLQTKGVPDIRNEAEYIQLESDYRRVFRENNLTEFLGTPGTDGEYGKIADLVGNFSVSVNEVRDRIADAQRVVYQTPQEIRDSLRDFYNIEADALVGYVLDPDRATTDINRIANAALIGGAARQTDLNLGRGVSEQIAGAFAGNDDINADAFRTRLTSIATQRNATSRLANLEKSTLSDDEVALAELDLDVGAQKKVKGLQSRERARFSGSSAITAGTLSQRGGY